MILSVIVPVYNEKIQITKNIKKIYNYFSSKFSFEIIIIDDGSERDLFKNIAKENMNNLKIIRNNQNYGKGYAIRKGIKISQGELILITDADLSTSIDQFDILYDQYLKGNDIVIGSRSVENSRIIIKQNFIRIIAGRIFNSLVRILTGLNFNDTQCGFKLYNGNKIKKLIPYCFINKFCIFAFNKTMLS